MTAESTKVLELLDALDWHVKQRLVGDAPELLERAARARRRVQKLKSALEPDKRA